MPNAWSITNIDEIPIPLRNILLINQTTLEIIKNAREWNSDEGWYEIEENGSRKRFWDNIYEYVCQRLIKDTTFCPNDQGERRLETATQKPSDKIICENPNPSSGKPFAPPIGSAVIL